jgi:hypothetical protein
MITQDIVNKARASEYIWAGYGAKADWLQFAGVVAEIDGRKRGIEVELRLVGNKGNGDISVVRTTFFRGSLRISRAEAEKILAETNNWEWN